MAASRAWYGTANAADAGVWPQKAIAYVVPFTAGGSTHVVGRTLSQKLTELLGKPKPIVQRMNADIVKILQMS